MDRQRKNEFVFLVLMPIYQTKSIWIYTNIFLLDNIGYLLYPEVLFHKRSKHMECADDSTQMLSWGFGAIVQYIYIFEYEYDYRLYVYS